MKVVAGGDFVEEMRRKSRKSTTPMQAHTNGEANTHPYGHTLV